MQTPEQKAAWYAKNAARIKAKLKARYKSDPSFREQKVQNTTKHYAANREHRKEQNYATAVVRNYGLTKEQIETKAAAQGGLCMLCKRPPELAQARRKRLCVDHDHVSGKNRDLLCAACNSALGLLKENTAVLARAIEYLNHWKLEHAKDANVL